MHVFFNIGPATNCGTDFCVFQEYSEAIAGNRIVMEHADFEALQIPGSTHSKSCGIVST